MRVHATVYLACPVYQVLFLVLHLIRELRALNRTQDSENTDRSPGVAYRSGVSQRSHSSPQSSIIAQNGDSDVTTKSAYL